MSSYRATVAGLSSACQMLRATPFTKLLQRVDPRDPPQCVGKAVERPLYAVDAAVPSAIDHAAGLLGGFRAIEGVSKPARGCPA